MTSNPYYDQTFWGFFWQLAKRLGLFVTGRLPVQELATDEIQLIVLSAVAASAALIGSFLMLRRMTMLANALSHTILIGIVLAYLVTRDGVFSHDKGGLDIHAMLIASLLTGVLTAFLTQFLTKTVRLQEDASIGLVFTSFFALGIILVTLLTRSVHVGTEVVMGNVDALHLDDCRLVLLILGWNAAIVLLFFKGLKITTFDPGLARALGFSTIFFDYLLMVQTSATVVGAFRAVGVLMVLAFLTGPILTARLLTHRLKYVLLAAVLIGVLSAWIGVALSRHLLTVSGLALSTGGVVVCVIVALYVGAMIIAPERGLISHWLHRRQRETSIQI